MSQLGQHVLAVHPTSLSDINHVPLNDLRSLYAYCAGSTEALFQPRVYKTEDHFAGTGSLFYLDKWLIDIEQGLIQDQSCQWVAVSFDLKRKASDEKTIVYVPTDAQRRMGPPDEVVEATLTTTGILMESWEDLHILLDQMYRRSAEYKQASGRRELVYNGPDVGILRHVRFPVGPMADLFTVTATCGSSSLVFQRRDHCGQSTWAGLRRPLLNWLQDVSRTFEGVCETMGVIFLDIEGRPLTSRSRIELKGARRERTQRSGFALAWTLFVEELWRFQWRTCSGDLPESAVIPHRTDECFADYLVNIMIRGGPQLATSIVLTNKDNGASTLDLAKICSHELSRQHANFSQALLGSADTRWMQQLSQLGANVGNWHTIRITAFDKERVHVGAPFNVRTLWESNSTADMEREGIMLSWEEFESAVGRLQWPTCEDYVPSLRSSIPKRIRQAYQYVHGILAAGYKLILIHVDPVADAIGIDGQAAVAFAGILVMQVTIFGWIAWMRARKQARAAETVDARIEAMEKASSG